MEKTIVVHANDKEIEIPVAASMAALALYRAEFTADLIRDLNEIYQDLHTDPFVEAMKRAKIDPQKMSQEEMAEKIMQNIDYTQLNSQEMLPDYETQIRALRIIWAMAKTADKRLIGFDDWCSSFDQLPIRNLVDLIYKIWNEANTITVELKN